MKVPDRLSNVLVPDLEVKPNTYDNNGNLLTKTDARGIVTTFTYDALNRLSNWNYSDNTRM